MKLRLTFLFIHFFIHSAFSQSVEKFSKQQVLEDLTYLRETLEDAHYNLYTYTSQEEFEANYQQIRASILSDSLNYLDAYKYFQAVVSKANNGHTEIPFPGQEYGVYAYADGTVLPLEIAFEEGHPLIRKNWSENPEIEIGSELLSINGLSMDAVLNQIYPQISAEREYFKQAKIELLSFPRLYWLVFGQVDTFEVEIQTSAGIKSFKIQAVPLIEGYEMKRDEIINRQNHLEFIDQTAYLKIGSFTGDEAAYRAFIDSAFTEIKQRKSENLILDIRHNDGGDDSFSDYLVSYLADKPFRWNSSYSLKTSEILKENIRNERDTSNAFWASALHYPNGTIYDYDFGVKEPQPEAKRFHGTTYLLVNRQSYSQSTVAAAQIQDYGLATLVGEETGEYPSLMASVFYFTLPNTGIQVQISKGYSVRVNGNTEETGVIPDIIIKDYLLDEKDEILEGVLDLIQKKK